jgi:hypothetical protein
MLEDLDHKDYVWNETGIFLEIKPPPLLSVCYQSVKVHYHNVQISVDGDGIAHIGIDCGLRGLCAPICVSYNDSAACFSKSSIVEKRNNMSRTEKENAYKRLKKMNDDEFIMSIFKSYLTKDIIFHLIGIFDLISEPKF